MFDFSLRSTLFIYAHRSPNGEWIAATSAVHYQKDYFGVKGFSCIYRTCLRIYTVVVQCMYIHCVCISSSSKQITAILPFLRSWNIKFWDALFMKGVHFFKKCCAFIRWVCEPQFTHQNIISFFFFFYCLKEDLELYSIKDIQDIGYILYVL